MRELKFRVWNGDYFEFSSFNFKTGCLGCNFSAYVELDTPQQFTGLKDVNSVDIYEGDILKGLVDYFTVSISGYFSSGSVGFGVNYSRCGDCSEFSIEGNPFGQEHDFEVVGNICENPELLK